jgi:hypothetical protein
MASKRHQRRKSCEGKIRFTDYISARRAATSHQYAYGQWMNPYPCKFCHGWHIGHPPKKVRQAIISQMAGKP